MLAPSAKRVDWASRIIAAAPGHICRAVMDPSALVLWLPPKGMVGELIAFDPKSPSGIISGFDRAF
jgi:hypothetical protein